MNHIGYDVLGRPNWDTYFMTLAFVISQKSIDPETKHGTVVIDDDKTIISTGYNGPPRGCVDENVPLSRPAKYDWMVHAESAAIINAARKGTSLKNSTFYITGHPCEKCMREIINVGAKEVIYGPVGSNCINDHTMKIISLMLENQNISMTQFDSQAIEAIKQILRDTEQYIIKKI